MTRPHLGSELRALLRVAWEPGESALQELWSHSSVPARPLHFDLHPRNLKWQRRGGGLAAFDFDGSVMGHPMQDLATALHYLRRSAAWIPEWDKALRAGYEAHGRKNGLNWPMNEQTLEDLVAARSVLLANDLLQVRDPMVRAEVPGFFAEVLPRLRNWRQFGRMI